MNNFFLYIKDIINNPISSLIIILNIIIIEGILSIDNAAILAVMISQIKKKNRMYAFKYGIIGAYLFRILSLLFISFLIKIWWLKFVSGLYLICIGVTFFFKKYLFKKKNQLFTLNKNLFNNLFINIIYIELIDLSFSIDNIFAAFAFSENLLLITIGIFIGILTMRIITKKFLLFIDKYSTLKNYIFLSIIILGLKLILSINNKYLLFINKYLPNNIISIIIFIILIIFFIKNYKINKS